MSSSMTLCDDMHTGWLLLVKLALATVPETKGKRSDDENSKESEAAKSGQRHLPGPRSNLSVSVDL